VSYQGTDDVNREITRIVNHAGLNPDDALAVETSYVGYQFTTWIRGVDLDLARAVLTVYLLDRAWVRLEVEGDALVLVQWDR